MVAPSVPDRRCAVPLVSVCSQLDWGSLSLSSHDKCAFVTLPSPSLPVGLVVSVGAVVTPSLSSVSLYSCTHKMILCRLM